MTDTKTCDGSDSLDVLVRFPEITLKQAKFLSEILHDYQDEGPRDAGWASDELWALRSLVDDAIEEVKSNDKDDLQERS